MEADDTNHSQIPDDEARPIEASTMTSKSYFRETRIMTQSYNQIINKEGERHSIRKCEAYQENKYVCEISYWIFQFVFHKRHSF